MSLVYLWFIENIPSIFHVILIYFGGWRAPENPCACGGLASFPHKNVALSQFLVMTYRKDMLFFLRECDKCTKREIDLFYYTELSIKKDLN